MGKDTPEGKAFVVPPLSGGLDCGKYYVRIPFELDLRVVPPLSGGLHCGGDRDREHVS